MAKPKGADSAPNKAFVRKDPDAWKHWGSTSVPNCITRDPDIPPEECWVWTWLASHTSTFEVSGKVLWESKTALSKNRAYDLLRNLEDRGLLRRTHEVDERGIPYTLYDLQPVPVPPEQRTSKPKKATAKPKKPFPAKQQDTPDSRPAGNPGTNSDDATPTDAEAEASGFPDGRESGHDQGKRSDSADGAPGGDSPDQSGKSERPAKTDLNTASESDVTSEDDQGGVSPDRSGESYKEEKTKGKDQPTKEAGWLDAKKTIPDTAGARYLLRGLTLPDGSTFGAAAVRALHEHVDALLGVGWTEQGITSEITSAGSAQVQNWGGFARTKLEEIPVQAPAAAGAVTAADRAHVDVTRMAKRKAPGAREAASLLGLSWHEPDRGDASAQEYLVNVVPAVAREFVESHRQELVAVLTRGAKSSSAA